MRSHPAKTDSANYNCSSNFGKEFYLISHNKAKHKQLQIVKGMSNKKHRKHKILSNKLIKEAVPNEQLLFTSEKSFSIANHLVYPFI